MPNPAKWKTYPCLLFYHAKKCHNNVPIRLELAELLNSLAGAGEDAEDVEADLARMLA